VLLGNSAAGRRENLRGKADMISMGRGRSEKRKVHTHLLPPHEECSLAKFDAALQTLNRSVKRRIVVACVACILTNQQVTVREAELLRAISDTLDCPLPPLVVGEAEGR
jgi:phosphotransferase system  glucose/maltose/N-acetylglucosamine-specific IIC component